MKDSSWAQCGLAGWGVVRIPWAEIPKWRKDPGPCEGLRPLPYLKLADEQTVLATVAALQAAERAGLAPTSFVDWGVLAGPLYFGRARIAQIFTRFRKLGPRSMPPLGIPTLSQHSLPSTISLILECHGPTFGVSGNRGQIPEVLLDTLSMLALHDCPGIWAILTGWDPEPTPDYSGGIAGQTMGYGIAFAMTKEAAAGSVRWVPDDGANPIDGKMTLAELAELLEKSDSFRLGIPGTGCIEIDRGTETGAARLRRAG